MSITASVRRQYLAQALKILLIVGIILTLNYSGSLVIEDFENHFNNLVRRWGTGFIALIFFLYVLFLATPFVPGVEIGWALMMIFGIRGVIMVYVATVIALSLSFLMGQQIPFHLIVRFLDWLHLQKAKSFALRIQPLSPQEKINFILRSAPVKAVPFLLEHRYLTIAVAFNLPGNALIGGGGGIGLLAGMSQLFPFPHYLATVSLAVSPIPLLILANSGIPFLFN